MTARPTMVAAIAPIVITALSGLAIVAAIMGHAHPLLPAVLWPVAAATWSWTWWVAFSIGMRRGVR